MLRQHLTAVFVVLASIADMNPSSATNELPDELVEDEVLVDVFKPLMTSLRIGQMDVGSLAGAVLRVGGSAHSFVETAAAETAGDNDRHTCMLTQRLEHLLAEALQIGDRIRTRLIAYTEARSGDGASELLQREMFR